MTPKDTSEPGHLPSPLGPPPAGPPPGGWVHLIMQHRFLIVSLLVVLFFGVLFARGDRAAARPRRSRWNLRWRRPLMTHRPRRSPKNQN